MRIPVRIGRKKPDGTYELFNGWTMVLNKHGAKIECPQEFNLGESVMIKVGNARAGTARVVWRNDKRNRGGNFEFASELEQADNLWGVEFPPSDWDRKKAAEAAQAAQAPVANRMPPAATVPAKAPAPAAALPVAPSKPEVRVEVLTDETGVYEIPAELSSGGSEEDLMAAAGLEASTSPTDAVHDLTAALQTHGQAPPVSPVFAEADEPPPQEPPPMPIISANMTPEMFAAASASLFNALVALLEKRGAITRDDLFNEMRRFT